MKPDLVRTVSFVGKSSAFKSTLLFQRVPSPQMGTAALPASPNCRILTRHRLTTLASAIYWADQGYRVLYISTESFRELPPPFHGASTASSDAFSQIRFMALPTWQDLLQHLYSVHCYGNIPRVVVVEGLDHYCFPPSDGPRQHEKYDREMHAALVCASLLDTMAVCTANASHSSLLITYTENIHNLQTELIINNISSDFVWKIDPGETSDIVRVTDISKNPESLGLEFSAKSDLSVMLNKVFSVTRSHFRSSPN